MLLQSYPSFDPSSHVSDIHLSCLHAAVSSPFLLKNGIWTGISTSFIFLSSRYTGLYLNFFFFAFDFPFVMLVRQHHYPLLNPDIWEVLPMLSTQCEVNAAVFTLRSGLKFVNQGAGGVISSWAQEILWPQAKA